MLCVIYRTKTKIRNANVDHSDRMFLLSSYVDCMVHRFKANVKEAAYRREELITQLEHGLIFHSDSDSHDDTDTTVYHIVYDLCGFLIKSRRSLMSCDVCYEAAT